MGCGIAASKDKCYYCGDIRDGVELLCGECQKIVGTKVYLQSTIDKAQLIIDDAKSEDSGD